MLAELLASEGPPVDVVDAGVLEDVRADLERAAGAATVVGGWTTVDPLRLAKRTVTWLLRCPRRALGPDSPAAVDDLVLGSLVDAAAKLATLGARRPITTTGALAYLGAQGDETAADHIASLGDEAGGRLLGEAATRIDRLVAGWPAIDAGWWPRVEEPARLRLAAGAVTVTGRLDMLLGGPPTGRPGLVVEVKGGRWHDDMRADAHLYALLVGLRDGVAPSGALTVVADGTTQVEPLRGALLRHAGERLELALHVAGRLAAGETPATHPGAHCGHCPLRPDCQAGRRWAAERPGPP